MSDIPESRGFLFLPHLKIQNVNTISSPLTWGFPAMSAFLGFMWNLERKLNNRYPLGFTSIGVICRDFQPQVSKPSSKPYLFSLTRNPLEKDGSTSAIIEEGRAYMDISLILGVYGGVFDGSLSNKEQNDIAKKIYMVASSMHICGGSVIDPTHLPYIQPSFHFLENDIDTQERDFREQRKLFTPGFTLISRDNLLKERFEKLAQANSSATPLDAWMDISRLNFSSKNSTNIQDTSDSAQSKAEWEAVPNEGWFVPIPIGYGAISPLYSNEQVTGTRDDESPFRFVECLYSIGEWVSPHRLASVTELLWYPSYNSDTGVYRCCNTNSIDGE